MRLDRPAIWRSRLPGPALEEFEMGYFADMYRLLFEQENPLDSQTYPSPRARDHSRQIGQD